VFPPAENSTPTKPSPVPQNWLPEYPGPAQAEPNEAKVKLPSIVSPSIMFQAYV